MYCTNSVFYNTHFIKWDRFREKAYIITFPVRAIEMYNACVEMYGKLKFQSLTTPSQIINSLVGMIVFRIQLPQENL